MSEVPLYGRVSKCSVNAVCKGGCSCLLVSLCVSLCESAGTMKVSKRVRARARLASCCEASLKSNSHLHALLPPRVEREFFIDNLLVRIHFIIVMIRWTGLAPWDFEFPFPGSLISTFLESNLCTCSTSGKAVPAQAGRQRGECECVRVCESGPLRTVHLSRHKWPGGLVY